MNEQISRLRYPRVDLRLVDLRSSCVDYGTGFFSLYVGLAWPARPAHQQ